MRTRSRRGLPLLAAASVAVGCTGSIDGTTAADTPASGGATPSASSPRGAPPTGPGATSPGGVTGPGVAPGAPGATSPGGATNPAAPRAPGGPVPSCAPGASSPPLRRLTTAEYRNTVRDVFPGLTLPEVALPADDTVAGFSSQTGPLGDDTLPAYADAAFALAAAAASAPRGPLGTCDVARTGEDACVRQIIDALGARAWRRPLEATERDDLIARVFRPARAAATLPVALEHVIARLLLAPEFLYHLEVGTPAPDLGAGVRRLTGPETASRLSYLLLRRPPDEALARAAAMGELADGARRAEHARRLLMDERAQETVWDFHREWLHIDQLDEVTKDARLFPTFDANLRASMLEETRRFVGHVFRSKGGALAELLLGRTSFVDGRLTTLYGLAAGGTAWRTVELAADGPRAGILGKAAFLATHATPRDSSVIFRGAVVRAGLLCLEVPKPPAEVEASPEVDRMRTQPCASCHTLIDPIGQTLEGFDAIGRHRTQLGGRPVNTAGELKGTPDADGPVAGPVALADTLAKSRQTRACLATQWLRFALARELGGGDACLQRALGDAQERTGAGLLNVILAHVASPDFVLRREAADGGACR